jgi:F0F1-type ATP synthase membrane subunit c/vacuolar-type H+-ATPase subunit K
MTGWKNHHKQWKIIETERSTINPAWYFVLATIIAVFGVLFSFNRMMGEVQKRVKIGQTVNGESFQKEQTKFFISVAIVEAIPILLIVFGFMQIGLIEEETYNTLLPLLIIVGIIIFALIQILTLRRDLVTERNSLSTDMTNLINTHLMIGLAMVSAIPIVSIVAILTMST